MDTFWKIASVILGVTLVLSLGWLEVLIIKERLKEGVK